MYRHLMSSSSFFLLPVWSYSICGLCSTSGGVQLLAMTTSVLGTSGKTDEPPVPPFSCSSETSNQQRLQSWASMTNNQDDLWTSELTNSQVLLQLFSEVSESTADAWCQLWLWLNLWRGRCHLCLLSSSCQPHLLWGWICFLCWVEDGVQVLGLIFIICCPWGRVDLFGLCLWPLLLSRGTLLHLQQESFTQTTTTTWGSPASCEHSTLVLDDITPESDEVLFLLLPTAS